MNKRVLFLLIAVLSTSYAQAQVSFGIRAGGNLTNWVNSASESLRFKPGFQAGVVVDIATNEVLSIQPAVMFSQLGAQVKEGDGSLIMNLNYIQVPVNVQATLGNFYVQTGVYLGYGIGTKVTVKVNEGSISTSPSFSKIGLDNLDYGVGVGLGLRFGHAQVGLNSQIGLANISNEGGKVRNIGVALTATFFF